MRSARLILLSTLTLAAVATPALASTWHSYRLYDGKARIEGATGTHSARLSSIVLPDSFKVRVHAKKLTFGPVGTCRSTGAITPRLVSSTATSSAAVLGQRLTGGTTYGFGTRGGASYRVAKFTNDVIKAVWVGRTRLPRTWIVVTTTTTPHASCHIGGVRESLGFPLVDAYGTIRANGY